MQSGMPGAIVWNVTVLLGLPPPGVAMDDLIRDNPDLCAKFVSATLEIAGFLKSHAEYATSLYVKRTGAPRNVAEKAVASLNQILSPSGRGSGNDLVAAVKGNWQFIVDSSRSSERAAPPQCLRTQV
jgi:ABC-type nitrate/sulfonate/bicarbonate transport system substrate-binding protein